MPAAASLGPVLVALGGAILALAVIFLAARSARGGGRRTGGRRRLFGRRSRHRGDGFRVRPWHGVGFAVLLLVVLAGAEATSAVPATRDLQLGADDLRTAARTLGSDPAGWTDEHIATASTLQARAQARLGRAASQLHDDLLVRLGLHVPWFSTQAGAALTLAESSHEAATALGDMIQVARLYRATEAGGGSSGHRALGLLQAASGPMADASAHLDPAVQRLQGSLGPGLVPPLRTQVQRAIDLLQPIDQTALSMGKAGPAVAALGGDGPRTYLLLLQNPSEIRPSGGFAGAVGVVTMNGGDPTGLQVRSQDVFNPLIKKPLPVPAPLGHFLGFYKNSLEIGDAGWDPNFPTSAATAEQLYTSATKTPLDGTVAIDPYAIQALLAVTGPVDVPVYGSFDSTNFFSKLNYIVNGSIAPGSGKQALGPITEAVTRRLLSAPVSQWPKLLTAFGDQASQRHVLLAMHDPALAHAVAQARWDGALLGASADYLLIDDANVGATKGDAFVEKRADLKVDVQVGGLARHQLTIDYRMPAVSGPADAALNPGDGSYRDYVRIYLPETAQVAGFRWTVDGAAAEGGLQGTVIDHGKLVVEAVFRLPRGHSGTVELTYAVPLDPSIPLSLLVQKQAGTPGLPLGLLVQEGGVRRSAAIRLDRDYQGLL